MPKAKRASRSSKDTVKTKRPLKVGYAADVIEVDSSRREFVEMTLHYKVEDFLNRLKNDSDGVDSQDFEAGGLHWYMELSLNDDQKSNDGDWVSLFLQLSSDYEGKVNARCSFALMDNRGVERKHCTNFPTGFNFSNQEGWGTNNFVNLEELDDYLDEECSLTIVCRLQLKQSTTDLNSAALTVEEEVRTVSKKVYQQVQYKWSIEGFEARYALGDVDSSEFLVDDKTMWRLTICACDENRNWSSVYVRLGQNEPGAVLARCKISLLDAKGLPSEVYYKHNYPDGFQFRSYCNRSFDPFASYDNIKRHMKRDGVLNIIFQIEFIVGSTLDLSTSQLIHLNGRRSSIIMTTNGDAFQGKLPVANLTIVAGGEEFPVHRQMIALQSSVLAAQLKPATSQLHIHDTEAAVFQQVLNFMYSGHVDQLQSMVRKLLAFAGTYQLKDLIVLCEQQLLGEVNASNAVNFLKFARLNSLKTLEERAIQLIVS